VVSPPDTVNLQLPNVLRDRIAGHRLHPRQPYYEVIEEALAWWEECGGWTPHMRAPVDGFGPDEDLSPGSRPSGELVLADAVR
jgi:hypothetical protein